MGPTANAAAAAGWTTADWALIVSICSAALSLVSLGWTVWSKWLHPKPKIRVGFAVMHIIDENGKSPPFLEANATNFGPTDTTITNLVARSRAEGWWYKFGRDRWTWGVMVSASNPADAMDARRAAHGGIPAKLPVGEKLSTYLPFQHQHLRDDGDVDVGFADIFGRYHWAPRKSVRAVIASIKEKWPNEEA